MGNATLGGSLRKRAGFTLLELIVVITIIGILGTLVVLRVSGIPRKAIITKTSSDLKTIINAAGIFRASNGRYPESLEELTSSSFNGQPVEPLLGKVLDYWGRDYIYEISPDGSPRVRSLGRDGVEGGEGEDADFEEPAPAGN